MPKIYERNPKTNEIRERELGEYPEPYQNQEHQEMMKILKKIDMKLEFLCSRDKNDYTSFDMWKQCKEEEDLDNTALSEQLTNYADKDEYR